MCAAIHAISVEVGIFINLLVFHRVIGRYGSLKRTVFGANNHAQPLFEIFGRYTTAYDDVKHWSIIGLRCRMILNYFLETWKRVKNKSLNIVRRCILGLSTLKILKTEQCFFSRSITFYFVFAF